MALHNTFILPLWFCIFPKAKVVDIERHEVGVVQSLRVRGRKGFVNTTRKYQKCHPLVSHYLKRGGFTESPRCVSLESGFSLWQEYTDQVTKMIGQLSSHRVLKLRYEQVLEYPIQYLRTSAEFCELNVSNRKLKALMAGINAD